jgi:hypothetical protein
MTVACWARRGSGILPLRSRMAQAAKTADVARLSLGIKASRGPSVSSSSKFYANVVRLAVRAHLLH